MNVVTQDARGVVESVDVAAVNSPQQRSLYQKRQPIYPKLAHGRWRTVKWAVMAVTLAIYYLLPWVRWDRGGTAPDQAVLVDMPARRFYFFFIEIWPQEVYYLTGLLILAAMALFLVNSVMGRVWCGYTCPQTVWTDLFIMVERLVEGDRAARIRLAKAPMSPRKLGLIVAKHGIWLLIALGTGGAWVFYFADAPTLAGQLLRFEAPTVAYAAIGVLTFTTYSLGGLMREQVCTYMCPWPRIQGAMLDEHALVVRYDHARGEPRTPFRRGADWSTRGHCIDCRNCVAVCPMGIDIREGLQLECINCGLCVDACNEVMAKIDLPRGLIRYDTDDNADRRRLGQKQRFRVVRPRTVLYAGVIAVVGVIMLVALAGRSELEVNVLRDRNPIFTTLANGDIRNGYTVKILNKAHEAGRFRIGFEGLAGTGMHIVGAQAGDADVVQVPADLLGSFRVYLAAPRAALADASTDVTVRVENVATGLVSRHDTTFRGPER